MNKIMVVLVCCTMLAGCAHRMAGQQAPALAAAPASGTVLSFRESDGFSGNAVASVQLAVQRTNDSAFDLAVTVSGEPISGLRSGQTQRYSAHWTVAEDATYFAPLRYQQGLPLFAGTSDGRREWSRSPVTRGASARAEDWTVRGRWAGWEEVTVPAGTFRAARYERDISFFNNDPFRWRTQRSEVLWFSPELGFWVKRQVGGTYVQPPWIGGTGYLVFNEARVLWELERVDSAGGGN